MMIRLLLKYVNALVSGYSFLTSSLTGKVSISGMPVSVGIELTNYCNLKCRECLSGSEKMLRGRGFMDLTLFDKIIKELRPYVFNLNLYFQGEPMLHPGFFSFLKRAEGIYTTVSTNGHFLSEENAERLVTSGLNKLIISLDGMDQSTYSSYRVNGNLDLVLQGIANVAEAKRKNSSKLKLAIQFLINRNNEHQIQEVRHYARAMKAKLRLKSMQIIDEKAFEEWLPSECQYSRYEIKGGYYNIKNRMPDRCARLWFNPVITWDGKVLPCCFDKDAHHIMGDLNEDSFRDIWNGPRYRLFRKAVFSDRKIIEICTNCTTGLKGVKY
jgi:radical SAM protein with 4Fe4S-binding SPASM domain